MSEKVLLDANVLVPISLCDILLRAAEAGLFEPRWSDEIIRETRRGVARRLITRGADPANFMLSIDSRLSDMQRAFRRATVTGWEPLVNRISLPDLDDRHVVAAARRCGANVIVTQNLRHFPAEALPKDLRVASADSFLLGLLERSANEIHACVRAQAHETGKYGKPALDLAAVLARLTPEVPMFVETVRKGLPGA